MSEFLEGSNVATSSPRKGKVRTTVSLPAQLYEEARSVVGTQATPAGSMNGFFVAAIRTYVTWIKRMQIDAQFAGMSRDTEYQKEGARITEDFGPSDWEAFQGAEKDFQ